MGVEKKLGGRTRRRRWPEEKREEVRIAYEGGESLASIAGRTGIPVDTVKGWKRQDKVSPYKAAWDRRNGETRRQAKALEGFPQVARHVDGATERTKAIAAMLVSVPPDERAMLRNALAALMDSPHTVGNGDAVSGTQGGTPDDGVKAMGDGELEEGLKRLVSGFAGRAG